jgi:pectate lyase
MTLAPYKITSAADSGTGTLRAALATGNRRITVPTTLTVLLRAPIITRANNLIIDGGRLLTVKNFAVKFEGTGIIVTGINYADAYGTPAEDCMTIRGRADGPTQVFMVDKCTFDRSHDGGLDIIWNHGRHTYGTITGNTFRRINKACLIDSGETLTEGGRYHITFRYNTWEDCYQRMPMARNADIHIVGDRYLRYGEAAGGGGGAKSARGCAMLVENIVATPRLPGSRTFDGTLVTKPRLEAVGPHQSDPTGRVRAINCPTQYVTQRDPAAVVRPPY